MYVRLCVQRRTIENRQKRRNKLQQTVCLLLRFLETSCPVVPALQDPTATNMLECIEYVAQAELEENGLFAHQSEHASFQIVTPKATIRLSHGRLHQLAMRDPTDQFDLPDHLTWQMNMAVDHNEVNVTEYRHSRLR